jgi:uncharacterized protein
VDRLFVDTSAWFAFANRKDSAHRQVREILHEFPGKLVTSNAIFDETISLLRYRLGHKAAYVAGTVLLDPHTVDLMRVTTKDEQAAWQLFSHRNDQRCSFTDCTSFVIMKRLGLRKALALDEDFHVEGFELVPDIELRN